MNGWNVKLHARTAALIAKAPRRIDHELNAILSSCKKRNIIDFGRSLTKYMIALRLPDIRGI